MYIYAETDQNKQTRKVPKVGATPMVQCLPRWAAFKVLRTPLLWNALPDANEPSDKVNTHQSKHTNF